MNIQKIAITKALPLLRASGAQFKIIEPDGTEHGTLVVASPVEAKRRANLHPRGTFSTHFKPLVEKVAVGESIVVPYVAHLQSELDKERLQASMCSHLTQIWGKQTYLTHRNGQGVELLRLA